MTLESSKWPKIIPPLTPEQVEISNDFMRHWHEVLPKKYGRLEKFNHGYSVKHQPAGFRTTLEIGAGLGEHITWEKLTPLQASNYYALELRQNMADELKRHHPRVQAIVGDCQGRLDFADGFFDRILAVHVLEHLPNLPACLKEMHRLCNKTHGVFQLVIPCEGATAYEFARTISARRIFEKRYKQPYDWFIGREHVNRPEEIFEELAPYFEIVQRSFFPLRFPAVWCNLVIGATLSPRSMASTPTSHP